MERRHTKPGDLRDTVLSCLLPKVAVSRVQANTVALWLFSKSRRNLSAKSAWHAPCSRWPHLQFPFFKNVCTLPLTTYNFLTDEECKGLSLSWTVGAL